MNSAELNDGLSKLHDGHLKSIALESERSLRLSFAEVSGKVVDIFIDDVVDLYAANFRLGNIVLCAEVRDSIEQLGDEELRGLAQSQDPSRVEAYKRRILLREKNEKIRCFVLQSSYGCDLTAIHRGEIDIRLG